MDKKTILFVDDEVKVLNSLRRGLIDEPYETLFADSGKKALEILEQKEVHILVTDMRMPEMSGLELLKIVREKYPKIVRIVLSGYTQIATLLTAINQGEIYKYITKPWQMEEEFKPAIRQAIEFYDLNNKQDVVDAASRPV
ncbi:MAG: response regulator [Phycisphaerae bacterium]|nr:response regulator [Phycisphaerae bacterium]